MHMIFLTLLFIIHVFYMHTTIMKINKINGLNWTFYGKYIVALKP